MLLSRRCIGVVPSASLALFIVGCVIASLRRALPRACGGVLLAPPHSRHHHPGEARPAAAFVGTFPMRGIATWSILSLLNTREGRMPRPLKILGVHGLGDHRTSDWKEKWSKTLTESFPAAEGLSLDCRYVTYDDIFEKTKLTAWECAKAFWKLTASGVSSIGRRERGVLSDISDRIQWTAGYVVAWVEDEDFKRKSRKRILDAVRENQPDIILAHSLGSMITYDAFSHADAREVEVRRILDKGEIRDAGLADRKSLRGQQSHQRPHSAARRQILASPLQQGGRCLHGGNPAVGSGEFPPDGYALRRRRLRRSFGGKLSWPSRDDRERLAADRRRRGGCQDDRCDAGSIGAPRTGAVGARRRKRCWSASTIIRKKQTASKAASTTFSR